MICFIAMSASQNTLPLFDIFKGKKIPQDLQEINDPNMSKNAWMTEEGFHQWISRVWRSYAENFERTLLIPDQYKVHKTPSVLEELGNVRPIFFLSLLGLPSFSNLVMLF